MSPRQYETFSKEFRDEAVRQARADPRPLMRVAQELGVKYATLRVWVRQAAQDESKPPGGDMVAENRRLRAENHQLRLERDILKKATAFFAKHSR